jgi:uroporphyrinogen III methyltransferase/synthase
MTAVPLNVISRATPLAVLQAKEAMAAFPAVEYRLLTMETFGDRHKEMSLLEGVAGDFFTRELDERLLNGQADIAVHSAKDLPYPLPEGLEVYALLPAGDRSDALVSRGNLTLNELPPGATVGTSSSARKAELLRLRRDLTVVSIRGSIEERIAQVDSGRIDALIVASCALIRLGIAQRIAQRLPFATHPLQGHLALTGNKNRPELKALFAEKDVRNACGTVTLAGFGPGNPELLTLAACRALTKADVIFHDSLTDAASLKQYAAEKICTGKRKGHHTYSQDEINAMLYQSALAGKQTVRLKGGDPMIFAHGREEIDYLQSRLIKVNVIPGISAAVAMAACTKIPLTHRGTAASVAFVTGHDDRNLQTPNADTLVYYMAGAHAARVAEQLIAAGRRADLPVALVHNVSLHDQTVVFTSLKELQYSVVQHPTPVLIVAGDVVSLAHRNDGGRQTLLTGTSADDYRQYPHATHTPLINICRIDENRHLNEALQAIRSFDWIVFGSRYGVRCFFEAFDEAQYDARALSHLKFASVGKTTTSELSRYRIYPDLEPETESESAEGIVDLFRQTGITNQRILLPRSSKGLKYLPDALKQLGNSVTDIPVYSAEPNARATVHDLSKFRKIIFSSPSTVDAFVQLYGQLPEGIQLVGRGKTTAQKLQSLTGL